MLVIYSEFFVLFLDAITSFEDCLEVNCHRGHGWHELSGVSCSSITSVTSEVTAPLVAAQAVRSQSVVLCDISSACDAPDNRE